MNHGSQFQQLWSDLCSEVLALQRRGYYGDGTYDTRGSGVKRTFLNLVPFPTFLHPFYNPNFLISETSECTTLAWSHFVFRNYPHCPNKSNGFLPINCGFLPRDSSKFVVLRPYKMGLWRQGIGLQVNGSQMRLPLKDSQHSMTASYQSILFVSPLPRCDLLPLLIHKPSPSTVRRRPATNPAKDSQATSSTSRPRLSGRPFEPHRCPDCQEA